MPGMGASSKIFEYLKFPPQYEIVHLSWFPPFKNELLSSYAKRMSMLVKHTNPILIGVSFGGILVQEMTRYIECRKVIIISSVKSRNELPRIMKISGSLGLHRLIPSFLIKNIKSLVLLFYGSKMKKKFLLYEKYFTVRDPEYIFWAINSIINWQGIEAQKDPIHIHGSIDRIFKINRIKDPYIKINGDHAIILTRHEWFNDFLSKEI
tara:strand:+ start:83 stop:706 length:624 start_codon:yes stop_codon:yes gene_type:complete